jgi:hypothetical protein
MKTVYADLEYLMGHLIYGHIELQMDEEKYKEYETYTDKEKEEYVFENGDLIIDDCEVDDYGPISNIRVYND